jgi:hypothetical protein
MKRTFKLLTLLALFSGLSLTSCSKDENPLLGKWKSSIMIGGEELSSRTFEFEDSRYTLTVTFAGVVGSPERGTYSRTSESITLLSTPNVRYTYSVSEDKSTLILTDKDGSSREYIKQ